MEYIYAALLLHYGKQPITEDNIVKVLQAAGITPDEIKVKALVAALKEVNIEEAIKTAATIPVAAPAAAPTAAPTPTPTAEAKPAEEKKEEKKEEEKKEGPSEEEIASGLASLFG